VTGLVEDNLIAAIRDAQAGHWANTNVASSGGDAMSRGDAKRFEVKLGAEPPFTDPRLTAGPFMTAITRMLLMTEEIELDTFTYILSLPGAGAQPWHGDVDDLFHKTSPYEKDFRPPSQNNTFPRQPHEPHLPPFGMVAIVPLANTTKQNGATTFLMGSHYNLGNGLLVWRGGKEDGISKTTPVVTLEAQHALTPTG
jgi:ectoine hydroxylase-related dioxygenase (phytanoyl-CoA dioxygenase family)